MDMGKIAIIAAAGWKGTSSVFPEIDKGIPEPLLPCHGQTLLSRQVCQLRCAGYYTIAAIGQPGSIYAQWASLRLREGHIDVSGTYEGTRPPGPWTWQRVDYVRSIGAVPVLIQHPGCHNSFDTVTQCMDMVGYSQWDELLVTFGDYIFSNELLTAMLELPAPVQIWMGEVKGALHHKFLRLNVECAKAYYELPSYDQNKVGHTSHNDKVRKVLEELGAPVINAEQAFKRIYKHGEYGWMDIDFPSNYTRLRQWVKDGKI